MSLSGGEQILFRSSLVYMIFWILVVLLSVGFFKKTCKFGPFSPPSAPTANKGKSSHSWPCLNVVLAHDGSILWCVSHVAVGMNSVSFLRRICVMLDVSLSIFLHALL